MALISHNPTTGETLAQFDTLSQEEVQEKLTQARQGHQVWKDMPIERRGEYIRAFAQYMRDHQDRFANMITQEMGMPLAQAEGEIEKVIWISEYYAENAPGMLEYTDIHIEGQQSWVQYDPLGVILTVAPWNFPVYLALRPVIPALMAGNSVVLKHASSVPQIAFMIDQAFQELDFPQGVFQYLPITSGQIESVIRHDAVEMVALTGSEQAGSQVASIAGSEIKETLLELGGNDPFIILNDADLEKAIPQAAKSRLRNCGQSCNAAKRFIVDSQLQEQFLHGLVKEFQSYTVGDPQNRDTDVGPLASEKALHEIEELVQDALDKGAQCVYGGERIEGNGYFYQPTILTGVTSEMKAYHTEVFGPIAIVQEVFSEDEAIEKANDSRYGLGASLWTQDLTRARYLIPRIDAGTVFVNSMVRSDPRLPYGGAKKSGYGREFSDVGIKEFTNIKSVVIR